MAEERDELRQLIIGLGKRSIRKNYYPDLQKKIRELEELNATLEHRVAERTRELEEAKAHMIEMEKNAALTHLIAGIAHEVNTPLGISLTAVTLLKRLFDESKERHWAGASAGTDLLGPNIERAEAGIDLLEGNIRRAIDIVQSFKTISEINEERDDEKELDALVLMRRIIQSLGKGVQKKIHIHGPEGITIFSNQLAIYQVITHLIENALQHGGLASDEGRLDIEIQDQERNLMISLKDNGPGIGQKDLPHIFEPFFTTVRGKGASGLGLHVVYNLVVRKLGGWIDCVSESPRGTEFRITLPKKGHFS